MQDIYRMMEERSSREFAPEGEFDKQAWAERKQSERQEAFDRADAAALRANSDPAALETYMRVAAQLPHHSATNILLIADRIPNATRVGTAEHWRRQGASVRRGQKAIPIIEPVKEYVRDDGSIGVLYDVRKVFDVSQTTARPCLPRRVDPHAALAALVARSPTRIEPVDDLGGVPAEYDHASGAIRVQRGLDEPQLLSALIVEAAHASMALGLDAYDRETHAAKADLAAGIAARRRARRAAGGVGGVRRRPRLGRRGVARLAHRGVLGSLFDEAHGGRRAMGAAVPGPVCRLRGGVAAHPAQPAPRRGARQRPVG